MLKSIESMTGLGKGEAKDDLYHLSVELKSVNNRFTEVRFKLPNSLSSHEIWLKRLITENFKRGSFDFYLQLRRADGGVEQLLDENKIKEYLLKLAALVKESKATLSVSPADFMRSEFYRQEESESASEIIASLLKEATLKAIEDLKISRQEEGTKLLYALRTHLALYRMQFKVVKDNQGDYQKAIEERLKRRFSEWKEQLAIDQPRILQEIAYYLERLDVNEEIDRIQSHLMKLDRLMDEGGEVGRQIDFLLQELGRETNTIGSKSSLVEISNAVVNMKVQLEKIREQALNLE